MKKLFTLMLMVGLVGMLSAQAPADPMSFSAEKSVDQADSYVLTFADLNNDVVNALTGLKAGKNGERQLFRDVSVEAATGKVTVSLTEERMGVEDLTNYLKGYLPQAVSRSATEISVE